MRESIRAIRYKNLNAAKRALSLIGAESIAEAMFDDGGAEPQGLLSVIPEDLLGDYELFYRLFDLKEGILVETERIAYSGFGPPADEDDYMGFISRNYAYVLKGKDFAIGISRCPLGARDIHHLEAMVLDGTHPFDSHALAERLGLAGAPEFEDLFKLIGEGTFTAEEIDRILHKCSPSCSGRKQ